MPPPVDGQSIAFEMLVEGVREVGIAHEIVDIGRPGSGFARSRWARAVDHLRLFPRYAWRLGRRRSALVYLTVAQSPGGFVRDALYGMTARWLGHRLVLHVHGGNYGGFYASQSGWMKAWIRRFLSGADRIIILGEALRGMFDFSPTLGARLVVVPNGLPRDPIHPLETKRLPAGNEPFRVLFLSNLVESKGFLEVIEAVRMLVRDRGRNVVCDFCGEFRANRSDDVRVQNAGHAGELFHSAVEASGLGDRIRYRGVVRGPEKDRFLSRAHAFVLPTWYAHEGQPISIIEAMAHGCVVVATDYRGIPELVQDGSTGWLLAEPTADLVADALERCLANCARYEQMSRAAIERFRGRHTRAAHLEGMLAVFEEVSPGILPSRKRPAGA